MVMFILAAVCAMAADPESNFTMGKDDAGVKGGKGAYLWTEPANWNSPPSAGAHVNIGDAEEVVHCLLKGIRAECGQLDLSEAGGPKGGVDNSLTIRDGGTLIVTKVFFCGKDKRGHLRIEDGGALTVRGRTTVGFNRSTLGSHVVMSGGTFESKSLSIAAMSENVTEGSTLTLSGGSLRVSDLLEISSAKAQVPGRLKVSRDASLMVASPKGATVVGYGTVIIEGGGSPSVSLGQLRFEKGKDSRLKLMGTAVVSIAARSVTLGEAMLDVSELTLKPGNYTIIDATSVTGTFTLSGDSSRSWKISYDSEKGDVVLTRLPE
jgi:hypothetical protein